MLTHSRSLFTILLLTTTFVAVPLASVSLAAPVQPPPKEMSMARMGLAGIKLGMKASQVERKLGKPPQMASQASTCCGTLLYWKYPELEVHFEVPMGVRQEPNATVYSITTRSSKFATLEGVRVGDRRNKVLRIYGTPSADEDNAVFYANDQYASSLVFRFENDRVVEISAASQLN
ncbi:hypothetical protein NIES2135_43960 [Leptolyngbya boryana NIES-2135]|uniref:Uncharacterized protein n=1 Tax=Leptolyngbya boryana NIES-2135 TaxID=1973484 RepID=A0A1Z4JLE6_LEPBY|nr:MULTISPECIES: hypothetical protein [Leptolyngbya]BAY57530.1 hypothetical protein NIES2135_43960 [Leptolyngbya boryana NIES-2135]MBD2368534.1 hypothetical protein [Leptolyngbya sp. FACHB-161]MBD2375205.1 hypothetical protein [Leptolyngbya sp. FACHB-238]MBD2399624.1 hypothetical protein [Leptolyngbya sp. FACHB-239]MBD2405829.1 hypothetical protein [Leptolyngbya sp. FACHB-402]